MIRSSGGNIFSFISALLISSSFYFKLKSSEEKYGISLLKFKINSRISWFYLVISTFSISYFIYGADCFFYSEGWLVVKIFVGEIGF